MADQNEKRGGLEITLISADWSYSVSKPGNWPDIPRISSIRFDPGATGDKLVIKDETDNGPRRCVLGPTDSSNDQRIMYYHGTRMIPYIDFSECIFSGGHRVTIELWREA